MKLETTNSLHGQVALVTGASSGLGRHFSMLLARHGATVVICARREDKLEKLQTDITREGGRALAVAMNVTDEKSVSNALLSVEKEYGAATILVNNAGVADAVSFSKLTESSWRNTLAVNLDGAWRVAHQFTNALLASGKPGCVVNIASILGLHVGFGNSAYAVSKAGVVQMTKAMALELGAKGIRVNALCPGYFLTDINAEYFASEQGMEYIKNTPAGRTGRMEELDGPLLLLCSNAGSFINGVALPVDGGHLLRSL